MSVTPVQKLALVLLALTAAHVLYVVAGPLDLSGDEAQYWTWSRHLDIGYHSKPPLIAYVIRGSCAIFGDTPLGVRFPAMLFADATAIVAFWMTRRLAPVLLLGAMPLFMAGTILMTTDVLLIFFWTLATAFAARDRMVPAGFAMGFGVLSKYAMLLWPLGLLFTPMRKRAWIPVAIALPFLIPMLVWNAQQGWVTVANIAGDLGQHSRWSFFEFIGGQVLAVGPVVLAMRGRDRFLLAMSLPYLAIVTLLALHTKIEVNWTAPGWVGLVLGAGAGKMPADRPPGRRRSEIFIAVYAFVAIIAMHFSTLFYPLLGANPRRFDPTARLRGWRTLGETVSRVHGNLPIATDNHYVRDLLTFYVAGHPDVSLSPRTDCLFVGLKPEGFDVVEPLPPVVIRAGGKVIASFPLWRCHRYNRALRRTIDVSDDGRGDEPAS